MYSDSSRFATRPSIHVPSQFEMRQSPCGPVDATVSARHVQKSTSPRRRTESTESGISNRVHSNTDSRTRHSEHNPFRPATTGNAKSYLDQEQRLLHQATVSPGVGQESRAQWLE